MTIWTNSRRLAEQQFDEFYQVSNQEIYINAPEIMEYIEENTSKKELIELLDDLKDIYPTLLNELGYEKVKARFY